MANSLWGKLVQRVGKSEVRYAKSPEEFHRLINDPTLETLDFEHVSEHMDRVVCRKRPEFATAPTTNCLPIGIFVTSYARLHLYKYMEEVIEKHGTILYCDTDSIYYVKRDGDMCVVEGEQLGQMKREHPNRRIVEFFAGGPKQYGYRHVARNGPEEDERAELKIRSFCLSYDAQQLLNFNSAKRLVLRRYNIDGQM